MIGKLWRKFWSEFWIFCDVFYSFTGLRIQKPIEIFLPDFCEWVFRQMTGIKKGRKIRD